MKENGGKVSRDALAFAVNNASDRGFKAIHCSPQLAADVIEQRDALLVAMEVTAKNIRSLGPAGAIPEPYKIWLDVVDAAIALAKGK